MRINAINSTVNTNYKQYTNPNFKKLIKDGSVMPIINSMSKHEKKEFKKFENRLSKSKYWDMKISTIKNQSNILKYSFINKKDKEGIITDGIYPYDIDGDTIKIYSIVYGPENTPSNSLKTLKFKSEKRAAELYNKYSQNTTHAINRRYNLTPLESLKMKEVELKMLEEATENMGITTSKTNIHTEFSTKTTVGNDLI